jgi:protein-arginine kinase activator protein McsA
MWTILELNDISNDIQTNPHIIIDGMSMEEFSEWIKINDTQYSSIVILENLLELLLEYEMYEHCAVVNNEIKSLHKK